jgi:hypothetical protein
VLKNETRTVGRLEPEKKVNRATLLRWGGRAGSLVTLAFLMAFALSGRESMALTPREAVGFLLFPGGVLAGQLLAWRYELGTR